MTVCALPGCDGVLYARTLCSKHYKQTQRSGELDQWPLYRNVGGSLVCECPDSDADPRRDFGMCSHCKRKPLALMVRP